MSSRTFKTVSKGVRKSTVEMQKKIDGVLEAVGQTADWDDIVNFKGGRDFFRYPIYDVEEGYRVGTVIERPSSYTLLYKKY